MAICGGHQTGQSILWIDDTILDGHFQFLHVDSGFDVWEYQLAEKMTNKIARVTLSYTAEAATALSLATNSLVEVIMDNNDDWWYVSFGNQMGYFPARCLQVISTEEEPPLPPGWMQHKSPENREPSLSFLLIVD
jgi:hypothetical protein